MLRCKLVLVVCKHPYRQNPHLSMRSQKRFLFIIFVLVTTYRFHLLVVESK